MFLCFFNLKLIKKDKIKFWVPFYLLLLIYFAALNIRWFAINLYLFKQQISTSRHPIRNVFFYILLSIYFIALNFYLNLNDFHFL